MTALLIILGIFLFLVHGVGFLLLNYLFLGLLELGAFLFSGIIGFIILGLGIVYILKTINKGV